MSITNEVSYQNFVLLSSTLLLLWLREASLQNFWICFSTAEVLWTFCLCLLGTCPLWMKMMHSYRVDVAGIKRCEDFTFWANNNIELWSKVTCLWKPSKLSYANLWTSRKMIVWMKLWNSCIGPKFGSHKLHFSFVENQRPVWSIHVGDTSVAVHNHQWSYRWH